MVELDIGWRFLILTGFLAPQLLSLFITVRRIVSGHGPSGIPLVFPILVILVLVFGVKKPILVSGEPPILFQMVDVVYLVCLTTLLDFVVPKMVVMFVQFRDHQSPLK